MKPYLGDAVMAQPAIEALSRSTDALYVLSSADVASLLGCYFEREHRLTSTRDKSLRGTVGEARMLRGHRLDAAVLVNCSFRSALICRLAGIPMRVGHSKEQRGPLLTHTVRFDRDEFQAVSVARLIEPFGLVVESQHPRLVVEVAERAKGKKLLDGATIGFQPGARDEWKRIPMAKAVEAGRRLIESGHRIALFGGPEEREIGESFAQALGTRVTNLIGGTSLEQLLGCLSGLQACFGADTGIMHLAVSVGCPTVQVFGSDRALKWGHAYPPHRVIRCPENEMSRLDVDQLTDAVLVAAASSNVQA